MEGRKVAARLDPGVILTPPRPGRPRPWDGVLAVEPTEERFPVAGPRPEFLSVTGSRKGPKNDLPHDLCSAVVQPDQVRGSSQDEIVHGGIRPTRNPIGTRRRGVHSPPEVIWILHRSVEPVGPPVQGIQFSVRNSKSDRDTASERRLARTRCSLDGDPHGVHRLPNRIPGIKAGTGSRLGLPKPSPRRPIGPGIASKS